MLSPAFTSFLRYACVGVLNTLIHWAIFLALVYEFGRAQWLANLIAFTGAVSFSYLANARWTFNAGVSGKRYLRYVAFMGVLAAVVGAAAQWLEGPPLLTLVLFSTISLTLGYAYARGVIFRPEATPC